MFLLYEGEENDELTVTDTSPKGSQLDFNK